MPSNFSHSRISTSIGALLLQVAAVFSLMLVAGGSVFAGQSPAHAVKSQAANVAANILGPEDQITIRVLDGDEVSEKSVRIESDGYITLELIGRVKAAGLTVEEFRSNLTEQLKRYFRDPQVTVRVEEVHSRPVSVLGAVNTPGVQQIRGEAKLVDMLSLAGGLRQDAGPIVHITRPIESGPIPLATAKPDASGGFTTADVNLKSLLDAANPKDNIPVMANDVILVPPGQMVYVLGEVGKAGGFVLNEKDSVSALQAVAMAQGLTHTAAPQHARLLHGDTETTVRLDLILAGKAKDVPLGPNDTLYIPSSVPKKAAIRALEAAIQTGTGLAVFR